MHTKVILITGASSGIGKATAEQLISEGHKVYVAARRVDKMEDLVERGAIAIAMDVTQEDQVDAAVAQILSESGHIDVLINNAGYAIYGAVEDTTIDDAKRQFEVNIFGLARLTQKILPSMRERRSGTIINVSSMGGKMYTPLGAWYHATKHALEGWSDCLRLELAPFNINVVIVEPGIIQTEFVEVMYQPMVDRSGNGAYKDLTLAFAKGTKKTYDDGKMTSPPQVIAKVMSKAVNAARPKTRYVAGALAKPMMWMRKYLGDRTFDKIIMSQVK